MGVIIAKKTIAKTMGEIIFPNNSPNLIHSLFNGFNNLEFKIPSIKNINANINDHSLKSPKSPPLCKGHNEIIKNTIKKRMPKLLLLFCFFSRTLYNLLLIASFF